MSDTTHVDAPSGRRRRYSELRPARRSSRARQVAIGDAHVGGACGLGAAECSGSNDAGDTTMSDTSLPRRSIVAKLVHSHAEIEEFDDEFWAKVPPHERIAALWSMVLEWEAVNGRDGSQLRLQRAVFDVQRR